MPGGGGAGCWRACRRGRLRARAPARTSASTMAKTSRGCSSRPRPARVARSAPAAGSSGGFFADRLPPWPARLRPRGLASGTATRAPGRRNHAGQQRSSPHWRSCSPHPGAVAQVHVQPPLRRAPLGRRRCDRRSGARSARTSRCRAGLPPARAQLLARSASSESGPAPPRRCRGASQRRCVCPRPGPPTRAPSRSRSPSHAAATSLTAAASVTGPRGGPAPAGRGCVPCGVGQMPRGLVNSTKAKGTHHDDYAKDVLVETQWVENHLERRLGPHRRGRREHGPLQGGPTSPA